MDARKTKRKKTLLLWKQLRPVIGATALAAAVLLLGVLAASPTLHESLHADAGHSDHTCAVTLFAHGVEGPATAVVVVDPLLPSAGAASTHADAIHWEQPRFWLLPALAPPSGALS